MNKDNAKDYLPLVQALADGKTVQLSDGNGGWIEGEIDFQYPVSEYRIKSELKEVWITEYPNGEVFFHPSEESARVGRSQPTGVIRRYREVIE
jgi:hypothetical protein